MRYLLIAVFCIASLPAFAQLSGVVTDAETKEPVPFANIWIEGEEKGVSADLQGKFHFEEDITNKTLIVSALGYETKKVAVKQGTLTIALNPKSYVLKEVTIKPKGKQELLISDNVRKSKMIFALNAIEPRIFARYMPYMANYETTPYIKSIRLAVRVKEKKEAAFNFRLFSVSDTGVPSNDLLPENLIVTAKKGTHYVTIDVQKYKIKFPSNGIFVAVEWLIIDAHKYRYIYTMEGETKKRTGYKFEPHLGAIIDKKGLFGWCYVRGTWWPYSRFTSPFYNFTLSVDMVLSD